MYRDCRNLMYKAGANGVDMDFASVWDVTNGR